MIQKGTEMNDLPQELLPEILSNLPTKEAVRNSILSKSWKHQWKNIYKLELEETPERRQEFMEFVDNLNVACTNSSRLKKFSLIFGVNNDALRVNEWLFAFIKPGIEEISLELDSVHQPLVFPKHLLYSAALKKLQLSLHVLINFPPYTHFPCLKVLTLKYVTFANDSSAKHLFNGCPSLEELNLVDCNWRNVRAVCITCPLLREITIREWRHHGPMLDAAENNGPLLVQNDETYPQIVINAPNLKSFAYDGDLINDYFLYSTTAADNASIEIHPMNHSKLEAAGYFVFKLLKAIPNVKKLSITDHVAKALARISFLAAHLPLFNKLTELRVNSRLVNLSCEAFLNLLRSLPTLKAIEFLMGVTLPDEEDEELNIDPLPACFGTSLKKIIIVDFRGDVRELNAIKCLLQVTPLLKEFTICSSDYVFDSDTGSMRLNELNYQIEGFPRASENCYVQLS